VKVVAFRGDAEDQSWKTFCGDLAQALSGRLEVLIALRADAFAVERWAGQDLGEWEWAWAFGPEVELRWRSDEGKAWAVLAWEDGAFSPPRCGEGVRQDELPEAADWEPEGERELRLWGRRDGGVFREGRFPVDLPYPVSSGEEVVIVVREYLHEGEFAWQRAVGLRPAAPGSDEGSDSGETSGGEHG
jgi:hypothetical protein